MRALESKWPRSTLDELTEAIDYGLTASATTNEVGPKFLRITDIKEGTVDWNSVPYCLCTPEALDKYRLHGGDIVFARTGATTGKSYLIGQCPDNAVFASYLIRLRPKPIVDPLYLSFFFDTPDYWNQISRSSTGTAQAGVNASKLKNIGLPLPPLPEQRRISAILDKADAIRRKRQEALALTDEFLRSAFLEMFGDPVTNPKGWEVVTVGDVTSDVRDGPHVSPEYAKSGVPFLSTRNIRPGRLILDDLKFVSQEDYEGLTKQFRAGRGDVLLTKGGTTGYAKVVDFGWPFTIWVHVAVLRPTARIRPEFLEAALNSPNCYAQSQKYTHGIANKDLGLTRIRRIVLTLPPLSLQDEYCRIRNTSLELSQKSEESLLEAERMFESLTQRAFHGEL